MKNSLSQSFSLQNLEPRKLFAADLTVSAVNMTPQIIAPGNSYQFEVILKNNGTTDASNIEFLPKLSVDGVFGNTDDASLGYRTYKGTIGAGKSVTVPVNHTSAVYSASGDYRMVVRVDPFNKIVEDSDANNDYGTASPVLTIAKKLQTNTITGTSGKDVITIRETGGQIIANINGEVFSRMSGLIDKHLFVDAGAGNDKVIADASVVTKMAFTGGGGNDTLVGGSGNDEISGANGKDKVYGGAGHDYCLGGAGADRVDGEAGNDICSGGGGNDSIFGGGGGDYLLGGAGNDSLNASDADRDTLSGNAGNDTGAANALDVVTSCETRL